MKGQFLLEPERLVAGRPFPLVLLPWLLFVWSNDWSRDRHMGDKRQKCEEQRVLRDQLCLVEAGQFERPSVAGYRESVEDQASESWQLLNKVHELGEVALCG